MGQVPRTTVQIRIVRQCWHEGAIEGELQANDWEWRFRWNFRRGQLRIDPTSGSALIREPLSRFLERWDYNLEAGGNYSFVVRSRL